MQKILLLSLCVHFFLGGQLMGEFAKLPALVKHYQMHKRQSPALSVRSFLKQHYSKAMVQRTLPEHESLPFFVTEVNQQCAEGPVNEVFALQLIQQFSFREKNIPIATQTWFAQAEAAKLLKPPQLA